MPDIWTVLLIAVILLLFAVPVIQQQMTRARRLRAIRGLEVKRGTRVIALIHRQERVAFLGIPFYRYIDINDSEEVLRAIRLTPPEMPIDFIVHTPGGLILSSEQIAMALQRHRGEGDDLCPALRHVGRDAPLPRRRRGGDGRERRARPGRP